MEINKSDNSQMTKQEINNKDDIDYTQIDTFHKAIWPVLVLAQCFSLMPVTGVSHSNPKSLKFRFKSLKLLVTLAFLVLGLLMNIGFCKGLALSGINAKNVVGAVFFSCGLSSCCLFLFLARRWPTIIRNWSKTELIFLRYPYELPKWKLSYRIRIASISILLLSILEHTLFLLSNIYSYQIYNELCNKTVGNFQNFMETNYQHVFMNISYNLAISIVVLVLNIMFTFIWNFMDLFIMIVSMGLAIRFEQLNTRIRNLASHQNAPEMEWTIIREHYVLLCELLEMIDDNLSAIILLSCVNNLYFICNQLLNIFNKLRWPINYLYFWYSLLYLIGRTAFVFLSAAEIHDKSKSALAELRGVPSTTWCSEIERLCYQMTTQCIALSGMKFYFMTRKLLFGMAGTIVTYELVLLQFDAPNRSKVLSPLCIN